MIKVRVHCERESYDLRWVLFSTAAKEAGFELVTEHPDLEIFEGKTIGRRELHVPYILCDRHDGAGLPPDLGDPTAVDACIAVFKNAVYHDLGMYNTPKRVTEHCNFLARAFPDWAEREQTHLIANPEKIKCVTWNKGSSIFRHVYKRLIEKRELDMMIDSERPIDVFFAGTVYISTFALSFVLVFTAVTLLAMN